MAAIRHLGFVKFEFFLTVSVVFFVCYDIVTSWMLWSVTSSIIYSSLISGQRPILRQRTKFRKDRSNRYRDIAIFVIFKMAAAAILNFKKIRNFNGRSAVGGQYASSCQISSKSVKRLQRYGELTVFNMAAVRHLGSVSYTHLTLPTKRIV